MTDEAKALVERLRDDLPQTLIEKHWVDDHDAIYKQREEAADLIETQAREIERLREALRGVTPPPYFGESEQRKAWWAEARAALAGDSNVAD